MLDPQYGDMRPFLKGKKLKEEEREHKESAKRTHEHLRKVVLKNPYVKSLLKKEKVAKKMHHK